MTGKKEQVSEAVLMLKVHNPLTNATLERLKI